jgi:hypothetical protein
MTKNYFAQQLGRMNKGVKKTLTTEQRAQLAERANRMNEARRSGAVACGNRYTKAKK